MLKIKSKKTYLFVLLVILICSVFINIVQAVTDTAPDPGSDNDPIVSKSYVDSTISGISSQIQQLKQLQDNYSQLLASIDNLKSQIDKGSPKNYEFIPVESGQKFFAGTGTEIILVSGKANSVKGANGGLIDTNTAKQLTTVTSIAPNHLLVSAANDGRGLFTVTKCYLLVKGSYSLDSNPVDIPKDEPQATPQVKATPVPQTVTPAPQTTTPQPTKAPVKMPPPAESFLGSGTITANVLNLREKADVTSKIVGKLVKGQSVKIVTFNDDWYRIKTQDGLYGWVLGEYVSLSN